MAKMILKPYASKQAVYFFGEKKIRNLYEYVNDGRDGGHEIVAIIEGVPLRVTLRTLTSGVWDVIPSMYLDETKTMERSIKGYKIVRNDR